MKKLNEQTYPSLFDKFIPITDLDADGKYEIHHFYLERLSCHAEKIKILTVKMDEFTLEVNVNEHHFIPAKTIWSYSLETLLLGQNYANPAYGVATICHHVRWLRWGHPSLFHTATSLLIWYKMFCVRDISYRLVWMEFINMFSVHAQSGMHSRFNWWIIMVLTYNPSVLMCVEITDAPKL